MTFKERLFELTNDLLTAIENGHYTVTDITQHTCMVHVTINGDTFDFCLWIANPSYKFSIYDKDDVSYPFLFFLFDSYSDDEFDKRGYAVFSNLYNKSIAEVRKLELLKEKQRIEEELKKYE